MRTDRPWEYDNTGKNFSKDGVIRRNGMVVCRMIPQSYESHGDKDDNAELIIKAVNSHESLVAALRAVAALADGQGRANLIEVAAMARAALQQVEG